MDGILTIQTLAMPADTNANGDIFGGWLVSQMDLAAGILAKSISHGRAVTVAIQSLEFIQPVAIGDLVSCYVDLVKKGSSSMHIQVAVWTKDFDNMQDKQVAKGLFVFVAIDDKGKPRSLPDV